MGNLKIVLPQRTVLDIHAEWVSSYGDIRFGQMLINALPIRIVFPELFYETDENKCWDLINENFVLT